MLTKIIKFITVIVSHSHSPVIGRFAPSPTGSLHFGTLVSALASYVHVRQAGGRWLLRIEDLDPPRVVTGSADAILFLLETLGFEWDGEIVYQSRRFHRYQEILQELRHRQLVFECTCSRRDLLASAPHAGEEGPVYPGTCRSGADDKRAQRSLRLRVGDEPVSFVDGIQGGQCQNLEREVGDFVLYRADGVYAYQLAVVIDDMDGGITQVVRGADLLFSTPRQIWLYRCLNARPPDYYHHPLVLGSDRQKLSKRDGDGGVIAAANGARMLWLALDFLGQSPPSCLLDASPREVLGWGVEHFSIACVGRESRCVCFDQLDAVQP